MYGLFTTLNGSVQGGVAAVQVRRGEFGPIVSGPSDWVPPKPLSHQSPGSR